MLQERIEEIRSTFQPVGGGEAVSTIVYVVNCRRDGEVSLDCIFAKEEDARAYCQDYNTRHPPYLVGGAIYGRRSFHTANVLESFEPPIKSGEKP